MKKSMCRQRMKRRVCMRRISDTRMKMSSCRPPCVRLLMDTTTAIHGVAWCSSTSRLTSLNAANATTASCEMRDDMGVTFCTAAPPLVSYFCVHSTGSLKLGHFAMEPEILASEGGLALLRVPLGDESDSLDPNISEYFIYQAGIMGQSPTLTQLPHPRSYHLLDHHTSIVRHRDDDNSYIIASLCSEHTQHLGWVDIWRGILFCDVLIADGRRTLRYVPLPPPLVEKDGFCLGDLRAGRDIAVVNGFIKCIDLQVWVVPGSSTKDGGFTSDGWSATIWSMEITDSLSEPWYLDCEIDSSELCDSLPELKVDAGTAQPTLQRLHIGHPTLSLHDDGIVYFLAKIDHRDDHRNGWVLAVDTVKKTIQGVAEFGCERTLGFQLTYIASRISEYLLATPVICLRPLFFSCLNSVRQCTSALLPVLHRKHLTLSLL
uniref:Uncharacterized protein n=1 Tax=Avena sativa TaxID=4498 RepID=A0ACD6A925_AVESA